MDYLQIESKLKAKFNEQQIGFIDSIISYKSLQLASMGHNDIEGYQVFTPEFIVRDMCSSIGEDILDFSKTILEPTSGDGAFTVYIYRKRLETIKENFEIESLKALSTIYSIEMDKELIEKQRNNIFTLVSLYIKKFNIKVSNGYFNVLKCIIFKNFIWAMFNSINPIDAGLLGVEVIYEMPDANKGIFHSLNFPVWNIDEDDIDFHEEEVNLW